MQVRTIDFVPEPAEAKAGKQILKTHPVKRLRIKKQKRPARRATKEPEEESRFRPTIMRRYCRKCGSYQNFQSDKCCNCGKPWYVQAVTTEQEVF